jgi:hypothetical protein
VSIARFLFNTLTAGHQEMATWCFGTPNISLLWRTILTPLFNAKPMAQNSNAQPKHFTLLGAAVALPRQGKRRAAAAEAGSVKLGTLSWS